mmetsp:Transcript_17813/g.47004  ORF Transcript_17813/g.47004 Transcript_17813/m.47004 type:complete len:405 (+) Transcript_17813:104-1318(+)
MQHGSRHRAVQQLHVCALRQRTVSVGGLGPPGPAVEQAGGLILRRHGREAEPDAPGRHEVVGAEERVLPDGVLGSDARGRPTNGPAALPFDAGMLLQSLDLQRPHLELGQLLAADSFLVLHYQGHLCLGVERVEVHLHALLEDAGVARLQMHPRPHRDVVAEAHLAERVVERVQLGGRQPLDLPDEELDGVEALHRPACSPVAEVANDLGRVLDAQGFEQSIFELPHHRDAHQGRDADENLLRLVDGELHKLDEPEEALVEADQVQLIQRVGQEQQVDNRDHGVESVLPRLAVLPAREHFGDRAQNQHAEDNQEECSLLEPHLTGGRVSRSREQGLSRVAQVPHHCDQLRLLLVLLPQLRLQLHDLGPRRGEVLWHGLSDELRRRGSRRLQQRERHGQKRRALP